MPPKTDLEHCRAWATENWHAGLAVDSMVQALQHAGHEVSKRTLERRLASWGLANRRVVIPPDQYRALRCRIIVMCCTCLWTDEKVFEALQREGWVIGSQWLVAAIRKEHGLFRRGAYLYDPGDARLRAAIEKELSAGFQQRLGRTMLEASLRLSGNWFSRSRMYAIVKELAQPLIEERKSARAMLRRSRYIVPGPNFLWSIDAHCKLEYYGFEIYGCIDAYSRFILWSYVGVSARTKVSIFTQYCHVIKDGQLIPRTIRADRGVETDMLADIHWQISNTIAGTDFEDCFFYGTSVANQRIESWWGQVTKHVVYYWQDLFYEYSKKHVWSKQKVADRVALLKIYMPIIRYDVQHYIMIWNYHRIRRQKNSPHVVSGLPNDLYHYPEDGVDDYSTPVPHGLIDGPMAQCSSWDIDEYLPIETMALCDEVLNRHGFGDIGSNDVIPGTNERLHPVAYQTLRTALQQLVDQGFNLAETRKPTQNAGWRPHPTLITRFNERGEYDRFYDDGRPIYQSYSGVEELVLPIDGPEP